MSTSPTHRTAVPRPGDAAATAESASQDPSGSGKARGPRDIVALAGVLAVGCLACLLPGLLAGGTLAATLSALGADEIIFGAVGVTLAVAAIAVRLVRRSHRAAAGSDRCDC
jgi:hypothetical protein